MDAATKCEKESPVLTICLATRLRCNAEAMTLLRPLTTGNGRCENAD